MQKKYWREISAMDLISLLPPPPTFHSVQMQSQALLIETSAKGALFGFQAIEIFVVSGHT